MNWFANTSADMRDLAIHYIAGTAGISENQLVSRSVKRPYVQARAMFTWIIRKYRPCVSKAQIGRWLGGRYSSTVLNLHRMSIRLRVENDDFDCDCATFEKLIADIVARKAREFSYACA